MGLAWGETVSREAGGTYEEEPFGEKAIGGREVGCERAHFAWMDGWMDGLCLGVVAFVFFVI